MIAPMKQPESNRYNISLGALLRKRLEEAAERNGRSLAGEIRFALNYYVTWDEENA